MTQAEESIKAKPWWETVPWSPLFWLFMQTIGVTIIVVQMRADIAANKELAADLGRRLIEIDSGGSKAVAIMQQRMTSHDDVAAGIMRRLDNVEKQNNELSLLTARETPKNQAQYEALQTRVVALEETVAARTAIIDRFMNAQNTITPLQQSILDQMKANMTRIEDRQDTLLSAIISTRELVSSHMRGEKAPPDEVPSFNTPRKR